MSREKKAQIIDELAEIFSNCSVGILADYRGLSAPNMTGLRRSLREAGIELRIIKNTLARFAATRTGREELCSLLEGPTAIVVGYGDVIELPKVLAEYARSGKPSLQIKGGFLGDRLLTSEDVKTLSTSPSREILIGKILGGMQSPIVVLISHLNSPIVSFTRVLQGRIKQLEGE